MFIYPKFLIRNTDRFIPFNFPKIEASIIVLNEQLATETAAPRADMIISFARDHLIDSQHVKDYPRLADLISTRSLPLQLMEDLFESSKQNELFRKDLEDYIRSSLNGGTTHL